MNRSINHLLGHFLLVSLCWSITLVSESQKIDIKLDWIQ